jgi:hypothetical protein
MEPIFTWNEETKTCTCEIVSKYGRIFKGTATCHPDDFDFGNRLVGERIASGRVYIEVLKAAKHDAEVSLAALKQVYYSINQSQRFNPKSYETLMLLRQIRLAEEEVQEIKEMIKEEKQAIKDYVATKEELYKALRSKRAK